MSKITPDFHTPALTFYDMMIWYDIRLSPFGHMFSSVRRSCLLCVPL